jgi:hypothetical protein
MLRVGPSAPPNIPDPNSPPPDPTGGSPDPTLAGAPPPDVVDDPTTMGDNPGEGGSDSQVDPGIAGYMGPEEGPFECQHCKFFVDPGSCKLVSGPIDPEGCCNLFTKLGDPTQDMAPPDDSKTSPSAPPLPPGPPQ